MLSAKNYFKSDISSNINKSALKMLEIYRGLKRFHFKVKVEARGSYKVTLHGSYKGYDLCVSETGLDIWLVYKIAEAKFFGQVKKKTEIKLSKIKKIRKISEQSQGGYNDEHEFQH